MALPKSSLSQICRAIADFVSDRLEASTHSFRVMIGNPASAAPGQSETEHRVNLFFYRIEPAGYFTGDTSADTWWLRLQCLVTGFGVPEDLISAGENDLRLLGEVMRLFHENPVLPDLEVGDEHFRLQVVFLPLSNDELNHIWANQAEVSYRTSVAYEMALAPVIPSERRPDSPLVGRIGSEIRAVERARHAPFTGIASAPPVPRSTVDTTGTDWAPVICFVLKDSCARSLAFERGSQELADFVPRVWVAGEPGAAVTLIWQRWTSAEGWQDVAETTAATAINRLLDPEQAADAETVELILPEELGAEGGQAVLYAERTFVRGSDGADLRVRSNPLLVTVFGGA